MRTGKCLENWQRKLISGSESIREAMVVMDLFGVPIVVVDSVIGSQIERGSKTTFGVITDGDIRRAIMSGISLDAGIDDITNWHPFSILEGDLITGPPPGVWIVPIADHQGYLKGLIDFRSPCSQNLAVIMAGGLGARLRPLTDETPKPMLEVGGKPILQRLVEQFVAQGFTDIYISVGYKADVIKSHFGNRHSGATIRYLEEDSARGTAGALALMPEVNHSVVVVNGDVLTDVDFRKMVAYHDERRAEITVASALYRISIPYGVLDVMYGKLVALIEKPDIGIYTNAGIYVLRPTVVNELRAPQDHIGKIDMPDILSRRHVEVFPLYEKWLDVGSPETLAQAQREYA